MEGPMIPRRVASVSEPAATTVDREATSALPVLARLPALGAAAAAPASPAAPAAAGLAAARGDGRVLGASLSAKLLVGVGVALLAAAVLPFAFRAKPKPTSDETGLPAWHPGPPAPTAAEAPLWPPAGQTPGGTSPPIAGTGAPSGTASPGADGGGERFWSPVEPSMPPDLRPTSSPRTGLAEAPAWSAAPSSPAEVRQLPPLSWTAPSDSPATTGRSLETAPSWQSPAGAVANQASQVDAPPYTPWSPPGATEPARTADRRAMEPTPWPDPATTGYGGAEPGVARFEGTIENPPVGTNHERPGSSLY